MEQSKKTLAINFRPCVRMVCFGHNALYKLIYDFWGRVMFLDRFNLFFSPVYCLIDEIYDIGTQHNHTLAHIPGPYFVHLLVLLFQYILSLANLIPFSWPMHIFFLLSTANITIPPPKRIAKQH